LANADLQLYVELINIGVVLDVHVFMDIIKLMEKFSLLNQLSSVQLIQSPMESIVFVNMDFSQSQQVFVKDVRKVHLGMDTDVLEEILNVLMDGSGIV